MNACESILGLSPYQGGKPIEELERELGIKNVIKLASNENPLGPSQKVVEAMKLSLKEVHRYPDGNGYELKRAISEHLDVTLEMISLGNGSNELLELIARVFVCKETDEVIFSQYAFVVYPLVTQALGATAKVAPAKDCGHDLNAMLKLINEKTKLIFEGRLENIDIIRNEKGDQLIACGDSTYLYESKSSRKILIQNRNSKFIDVKATNFDGVNTAWIVEKTKDDDYNLLFLTDNFYVEETHKLVKGRWTSDLLMKNNVHQFTCLKGNTNGNHLFLLNEENELSHLTIQQKQQCQQLIWYQEKHSHRKLKK